MKVRLKTGQRITLTPEVMMDCMGQEEPEKLMKWKKEYQRETVQLRHEEMMRRKNTVGEDKVKTEEEQEKEVLKQLKERSNRLNTIKRERYGNEIENLQAGERGGKKDSGILGKIFSGKNSRKAESQVDGSEGQEVTDGNNNS
ncbi:MAG: hypothetical protein KJ899_15415 [Gammaproteobacteria bacterium]|nr:hypothetical protein [Gammaproteobacteria bacterium]